jgi:FG-GAP-like repeat
MLLAMAAPARADIVDVARNAGITEDTRTFSVSTSDFDKDGRPDIFLVRHNPDLGIKNLPASTLFRNTGRRFTNFITNGFGHTDKHGCAWGDANSDGRPDLFCAIGFHQFSKNELWIQNRDHSFTNKAQELGLTKNTHGRYRYATFVDANDDGRPDIYVARFAASCGCGLYEGDDFPNELWINEGDSFRKAPEFGLNVLIGAKKDNASCAQAVDYDRDGDQDLLVCGYKDLHLYRNNSGKGFTDVTSEKGIGGNVADARLVDLNRDHVRDLVKLSSGTLTVQHGTGKNWGRVAFSASVKAGEALAFGRFNPGDRVDIYVVGSRGDDQHDDPDAIFMNKGHSTYERKTIPATSGSGDDVDALDYNGDGRTDFVVTNGDRKKPGPVQLFTYR